MAVAIRQAVDPSYLLQRAQWQPQGWSVVRQAVVRQIPLDAAGQPTIATTVDAFEWDDVQAFGIGNADSGLTRMRAAIQARGSDLYAYALLRRDVVNLFGVHIWSYRLVLLHSLIPLLEWAVVIMAVAFAAIIFLQYVTIGKAPALQDLQNFFSGLFKAAGDAGGTVAGGLSQPFLVVALAGGVLAILYAQAEKAAGVKTRGGIKAPSGSISLKGKHGGVSVGT